jgi:guanidinopropionase
MAKPPVSHAANLAALRKKYLNADPSVVHDPEFKKVFNLLFDGGRRAKPYEGIATFLDAPLRLDAPSLPDFGGLDIALIGVPMDLGVTNRPGARLGPRAVRQIERIGPYHHTHRKVPASMVKIADVGDVPFRSRYSLEDSHHDIEAYFAKPVVAGVTPVAIGGDHSITLPILKAVGAKAPVGLIHIDAHCDTSGPFEGCKFHHGGPFREAVLAGVLDPARTIQIGIRGNSEFLWEFSYDSGMTVIHAEAIDAMGIDAVLAKIKAVVGLGPTYLTFDVDSLDPAFAPGTGTPEIGGLSTREALALIRGCAGLNIVGGDVVEVAPQYDASTNTAHAAAQVLFEIVTLIAMSRAMSRANSRASQTKA